MILAIKKCIQNLGLDSMGCVYMQETNQRELKQLLGTMLYLMKYIGPYPIKRFLYKQFFTYWL